MQQRLDESLSGPRFAVGLLGAFALLALAMAAVGIYGVSSYIAGRRFSEFGLRMALGARPAELVRLLLWSGLRLALAGCAIGMAGALVVTRVMSSAVFGVSPRDPLAFSVALAILLAAAAVATALPARRAASIDPMVALRHE
jgi:ABC-type antimicrobial peptide transport system permease subunit